MKRYIEILLVILLLISFLFPWYINIGDMSKQSGLERLLFSLIGGLIGVTHGQYKAFLYILVGLMLVLTIALCIKVIINRSGNTWWLRIAIFFLITGSFFIPMIRSIFLEIDSGKQLLESVYSMFSIVLYGYYTALLSATGLLLCGKR